MVSKHNESFKVTNLFNVEGWTCVVTGGATGIGLMIAQAFANNGARVYMAARRHEVMQNAIDVWGKDLAHPKGELLSLQCDITDKKSIAKMVQELEKKEKKIDLLVNNAGVSQGSSDVAKGDHSVEEFAQELFEEDQSDWEDVYRTNVIGHFFTAAALLPLLSAANKLGYTPSIINISSISGITRTTQHHFKYNVSKAASVHLNTLLAQELRRNAVNIRVNSIAPGIFPSQMTTKEEADDQNKSTIPTGDNYGEEKGIPAGRPGNDHDMAQVALMLAVNQYAYGQTIAIDGGYLVEHP